MRVLSDSFFNQLEDSAFITNLLQTELLNESLRSLILFEHFGKYLFSQLAGQHAVFNQVNQLCQVCRGYLEIGNGNAFVVHVSRYIAQQPVGNCLAVLSGLNCFIKVFSHSLGRNDLGSIIFRQTMLAHQACLTLSRQLRQSFADTLNPGIVQLYRNEVRLREVTVVMCFFLRTHGQSYAVSFIPGTGFLNNVAAVFQNLFLALNFIVDSALQSTEGVQVFDFGTGTEFLSAFGHDGDVSVAAQAAFLHFAVANIGIFQNCFQVFHVSTSFGSTTHIRLGYDFNQRYACTVVVNCGGVGGADGCAAVVQLACILFHVDTGNADAFMLAVNNNVDMTAKADRFIKLGNLIVLGQVRIEVVFTVEFVVFLDIAVQRQACFDSEINNLLVQHRQCTGHTQANRAYMGVGQAAESSGAAAECFSFGFQLGMNFQADNGNIFSHYLLPPSGANTL